MDTHYSNYGMPYPYHLDYIKTGRIKEYDPHMDKSDLMIMTGASANHFVCSLNCMLSFISALPHSSFLFIDYGLPKQDICYLSNAFRLIHDYHLAWNSTAFIYYRVYNWSVFPHWMHMDATNHGGYTWKPICIRDALYEWKAVVMWNDAGNQFRELALRGLSLVKQDGVYISKDVSHFTGRFHPLSYQFLREHGLVKPFDWSSRMGIAAYMLFDYRNEHTRQRILVPWFQCAFTRKCMALIDVPKKYHLPEQAILSSIMLANNISSFQATSYRPLFWRDKNYQSVNSSIVYDLIRDFSSSMKKEYPVDYLLRGCEMHVLS